MGAARGRLCPPLQRVAQQWVASLDCVETQRRAPKRSSQARKALRPNWHGQLPGQSKHRAAAVRPLSRPAAAAASDPERATSRCGSVALARPSQEISTAELSREASRINRSRQISTAALASWIFSRKATFAVIAAPAAGLEQLGQILQPLLGKSAPARDNIAATCHVESMCHEPARKEKNGRGRNEGRINLT